MPDYRPLSKDSLKFETEELKFQREMNGHRYLRWKKVLETIDPDQTYEVLQHGFDRKIMRGDEILAAAWRRVDNRSTTYINEITPVSTDTPLGEAPPRYRNLKRQELQTEGYGLQYEKEANSQNYLRWKAILDSVDPNKNYEITQFGSLKVVKRGDELLAYIWARMEDRKVSFVNALRPVADDYQTPNEDLWYEKKVDPATGKTLVGDEEENLWQVEGWFDRATAAQLKKHKLAEPHLDELTERVIRQRCRERRCDDEAALEAARPHVRQEIQHSYAVLRAQKQTEAAAQENALFRAMEIFDRAYGRQRMLNAGVDIADHPDLNSYQAFYDRGLAPPTHEEMAEVIIKERGPQGTQKVERQKRTPIPEGTVVQGVLDLGEGKDSPAGSTGRNRSQPANPTAKSKSGRAPRSTAKSKTTTRAPAEIKRFAKKARRK